MITAYKITYEWDDNGKYESPLKITEEVAGKPMEVVKYLDKLHKNGYSNITTKLIARYMEASR